MSADMKKMRATAVRLETDLKHFGRYKCKWNKHRFKTPKRHLDCGHPAMAFGGMTRNTECELENCPRLLYGDEGSEKEHKKWSSKHILEFEKRDRKERGE